ncbi:MAG: tetratricopeptide repeat protein [Betaproteobacteria bacterium]|nr:tetratricopeptide repeat protein [Betaproteobacteria bacterium]
MSLLMDALKKAELAKRQGQGTAAGDSAGPEATTGLALEPLIEPSVAESAASSPRAPNLSPQALASHLEELDTRFLAEAKEAAAMRFKAQQSSVSSAVAVEPTAEQPGGGGRPPRTSGSTEARRPQAGKTLPQEKSAAQNLFAAKQVDESPTRKTFALAIGTATFLAICGIGGYFWWQLQPKTSLVTIRAPVPPAAMPSPGAVPPAPTLAAPPAAPIGVASSAARPATAAARDKLEENEVVPRAAKAPDQPRHLRQSPATEPDTDSPVRVTKAPLKVDPALLRGFDAYNRGDLELAQREYERAQKSDPRNTDAMHGLAAVAVRQGRHDQADLLYRQIIEADPQDPAAMSALINIRTQIDPGAAESRLKSLSAAQPELAAPQFALGNLYARQDRWNEAQQAYFRAYGAEQDNPDILYNLAVSLEHLRQNKLAAQYYSLAIAAAQSRPAGFDRDQATARLQALLR